MWAVASEEEEGLESEVVGHFPHFLGFLQVKFSTEKLGIFVPEENISTQKSKLR